MMVYQTVKSSQIDRIGYDHETSQLGVVFKGGGEYIYNDVPVEIYRQLIDSDSLGSAFHQLVKKGGYEFSKTILTGATEEIELKKSKNLVNSGSSEVNS